MAYRLSKPEVGMTVYKPYSPAHAGVIIDVEEVAPHRFGVLWLNGEKTIEAPYDVCDFDALIEDHRKKLATHLKTLDRLKGLIY